jgi:hypothetical protein
MSGAARAVITPRDGDSRLGKPRPLQTNEHLVDRHEAISQGKERRRRDSIGCVVRTKMPDCLIRLAA